MVLPYKSVRFDHRTKSIKAVVHDPSTGTSKLISEPYKHNYFVECQNKFATHTGYDGVPVREMWLDKPSSRDKKWAEWHAQGTKTYELRLDPERKWLQKTFGHKQDEILSHSFHDVWNVCSLDIETKSMDGQGFAKPPNCFFPINLISLTFKRIRKVFVLSLNEDYNGDFSVATARGYEVEYIKCDTERDMLLDAFAIIREQETDIVTGWNIEFFDIPYMFSRLEEVAPDLVRDNEWTSDTGKVFKAGKIYDVYLSKFFDKPVKSQGLYRYDASGIMFIDYQKIYKKFTYEMRPSYSLESICGIELEDFNKLEKPTKSFQEFWQNHWDTFVDYNIIDSILIPALDEELGLFEQAWELATEALIPIDQVFSSVRVISGVLADMVHEEGRVTPDHLATGREKEEDEEEEEDELKGGYVFALKGFYKWFISFDFESLYPFIMMLFNISPETIRTGMTREEAIEQNLIVSPFEGVFYDREVGLIPRACKKFFDGRKFWKEKKKDFEKMLDWLGAKRADRKQLIKKTLINSMYGVFGNEWFPYFDIRNANSVTAGGRSAIIHTGEEIEAGFERITKEHLEKMCPEWDWSGWDSPKPKGEPMVILTDTDSTYITIARLWEKCNNGHLEDLEMFLKFGQMLDKKLFKPFFAKSLNNWGLQFNVKSNLNFKREKIGHAILVFGKKKYLGLALDNEGAEYRDKETGELKPKFFTTGVEIKRTDTSDFVRDYAERVVLMILKGGGYDGVTEMLKGARAEFFASPPEKIARKCYVRNLKDEDANAVEVSSHGTLSFPKTMASHFRACVTHNHINEVEGLGYEPISSTSLEKMNYLYIHKNDYGVKNVGFIGKFDFKGLVSVNYELQFERTFEKFCERLYDVLDWNLPDLRIGKSRGRFK